MKSFLCVTLLVSLLIPAAAVHAAETDNNAARNLVEQVLDRYIGNTEVSRMSLVTCAYRDKGESIGCSSAPRRKTVQSISKMYGQKLKDSRGLMLILEPVAEYGIGILQYDYVESGADSDQWMYLPELDQVKRIASSNDAPKKGSLFGSEFSLEDMERQKLNEYTYNILGKETVNGAELVKIEHIPTPARAKKSNYSKRIQWIDEARLLVIKEEYYELSGELFKVKTSSDLVEADNIWTAKKVMMRNLKTRRVSMLLYADVTYNLPIQDEALTPRILSDAVFRENFIKSLRQEKPASAMPVARQ